MAFQIHNHNNIDTSNADVSWVCQEIENGHIEAHNLTISQIKDVIAREIGDFHTIEERRAPWVDAPPNQWVYRKDGERIVVTHMKAGAQEPDITFVITNDTITFDADPETDYGINVEDEAQRFHAVQTDALGWRLEDGPSLAAYVLFLLY